MYISGAVITLKTSLFSSVFISNIDITIKIVFIKYLIDL